MQQQKTVNGKKNAQRRFDMDNSHSPATRGMNGCKRN
jgi:hypothetical protein